MIFFFFFVYLSDRVGEILVHSASLFKGYFVIQPDPEKPDPDALAFVHIGEGDKTRKYYKTGDVGQVDDDGYDDALTALIDGLVRQG